MGLSVRDWPESEQPRGRLLNCGPDSLSDAELLAIFLRVGVKGMTVMDLSRTLLKQFEGFRGLFKAFPSGAAGRLRSGAGQGGATLKALAAVTVRYLAEEMQRGALHRALPGRAAATVWALPGSRPGDLCRGLSGHQAPRAGRGRDVPGHPQQRDRVSSGNRQAGPAVERRRHGGRTQPSLGQPLAQPGRPPGVTRELQRALRPFGHLVARSHRHRRQRLLQLCRAPAPMNRTSLSLQGVAKLWAMRAVVPDRPAHLQVRTSLDQVVPGQIVAGQLRNTAPRPR